jgi:hypothetical protein
LDCGVCLCVLGWVQSPKVAGCWPPYARLSNGRTSSAPHMVPLFHYYIEKITRCHWL